MSIVKECIKKILPVSLKEFLILSHLQQTQAKKELQIAGKNRLKIEALLKGSAPILLELGARENRGNPGWTYADLNENCDLCMDLTKQLPFPDNSVNMIYSSHLLEHFNHRDLINFLAECHRILKRGGIFSAAVPNARIYLDGYQNPGKFDPDVFCRYQPAFHSNSKIDYVNYIAYMDGQHHYMFDEENLIAILKKECFRNARLREFDATLDIKNRDSQSLYVLAEK